MHPWGNGTLPTATAVENFIGRLVVDAVWENRSLDLRALEARGIFPWWLTPEEQQTPSEKAAAERDLHPQAGWLVGFGTDEHPELLHMPYLLASSFLTDLPEPSAERKLSYNSHCSRSECRSWPIERILYHLNEARGPYLRQSASSS